MTFLLQIVLEILIREDPYHGTFTGGPLSW